MCKEFELKVYIGCDTVKLLIYGLISFNDDVSLLYNLSVVIVDDNYLSLTLTFSTKLDGYLVP